MKLKYDIQVRRSRLVNTDPQRRCYDGAHFSSEIQKGEWEPFATVTEDKVEHELKFWRELNLIATNARGPGALCEYRAVPAHTEINLNQAN